MKIQIRHDPVHDFDVRQEWNAEGIPSAVNDVVYVLYFAGIREIHDFLAASG